MLVLVAAYVFFWSSFQLHEGIENDELIAHYRKISKTAADKFLCCDTNMNTTGDYSWTISYLLEADRIMFEVTGDTFYGRRFIDIASIILNNRDDKRNIKDWKGICGPGWSESTHWSPGKGRSVAGKPMRYLVNDAMILKPMLEFARLVRDRSLTQYDSIARVFVHNAKEVMDDHIRTGWSKERGTFIFPKGSPIWSDGANIPLNQSAQAARALLLLYSQTGESEYRILVQQIADSLKKEIRIIHGSYQWNYWGGLGDRGWSSEMNISEHTPEYGGHKTIDDVGHAALVVQCIVELEQAKITFSRKDIDMLVTTFHHSVERGNTLSNNLDNNSGTVTSQKIIPSFKWMVLSTFDPKIRKSFSEKYLESAKRFGGAGNAYLIAALVLHNSLNGRE